MPHITCRQGETIECCLRKFRRAVEKCGLPAKIREKEFYIKPTTARKEALNNAKKRSMKMQKKQRNNCNCHSRNRSVRSRAS